VSTDGKQVAAGNKAKDTYSPKGLQTSLVPESNFSCPKEAERSLRQAISAMPRQIVAEKTISKTVVNASSIQNKVAAGECEKASDNCEKGKLVNLAFSIKEEKHGYRAINYLTRNCLHPASGRRLDLQNRTSRRKIISSARTTRKQRENTFCKRSKEETEKHRIEASRRWVWRKTQRRGKLISLV
jgi:hypothetical protein